MDERLAKALEFSQYRVTINQQKQNLKLRLENFLTHPHNGGIFKVTDQLMAFVDLLIRRDMTEAVLLDSRENPVKVDDLHEFQSEIISLYFEATNEYLAEFEKIRKARSTNKAVDL